MIYDILDPNPLKERNESNSDATPSLTEYAIAKAAHVARIHRDIPLDKVAPILCAGLTAYKALKESGARTGQTVAIVGAAGGLGSLAIQYAKAMGLQVIAIASGDEQRQLCEKYGVVSFIDFATSKDLVADIKAATEDGLGPHAAILMATGEEPFHQATEVNNTSGQTSRTYFIIIWYMKKKLTIESSTFAHEGPWSSVVFHRGDFFVRPSFRRFSARSLSREAM